MIEIPTGYVKDGEPRRPKKGEQYVSRGKVYTAEWCFTSVTAIIVKKETMEVGKWCRIPEEYRQEIQDELKTPEGTGYQTFVSEGNGRLRKDDHDSIVYNLCREYDAEDEIPFRNFLTVAEAMGWAVPDFKDWVGPEPVKEKEDTKVHPSEELAKLIREDEDLAWVWHCEIAEQICEDGATSELRNKAAARVMSALFTVDMTESYYYKSAKSTWPVTAKLRDYEGEIQELQQAVSENHFTMVEMRKRLSPVKKSLWTRLFG